jgi:hypothetical protein
MLTLFGGLMLTVVTGTSTERWFGSDEWVTDPSRVNPAPATEAGPL